MWRLFLIFNGILIHLTFGRSLTEVAINLIENNISNHQYKQPCILIIGTDRFFMKSLKTPLPMINIGDTFCRQCKQSNKWEIFTNFCRNFVIDLNKIDENLRKLLPVKINIF